MKNCTLGIAAGRRVRSDEEKWEKKQRNTKQARAVKINDSLHFKIIIIQDVKCKFWVTHSDDDGESWGVSDCDTFMIYSIFAFVSQQSLCELCAWYLTHFNFISNATKAVITVYGLYNSVESVALTVHQESLDLNSNFGSACERFEDCTHINFRVDSFPSVVPMHVSRVI